jgi:hypothetical protein
METKKNLIDKYVIFFVNGNEFIQPRHLEYNFIIQLVKEKTPLTIK